MSDNNSQDAGSGDDEQMKKIQEQKSALARQLIGYVFFSLLASGAMYAVTIFQNPDLLPTRTT